MSALSIQLLWQRAEAALVTSKYSSAHTVQYGNRYDLPVDAAPEWGGDPANTNTEQALAAAYDHASEVMVENLLARDAEEGIGAFIAKRAPTWQDS